MKQKIFTIDYCNYLLKRVKNGEISDYEKNEFPVDHKEIQMVRNIEVEKFPNLYKPEDGNLKDKENSKIIYETYKELTPTQARDVRLWTYMTHVQFFDYMKARWDSYPNNSSYITRHWFLRNEGNNREYTRNNGIAKLWWIAHLTYDEDRQNPYELTDVALDTLDTAGALFERALGRIKNVRFAFLEFIAENEAFFSKEKRDKIRDMAKYLNLKGGTIPLAYLTKSELKELLSKIKTQYQDQDVFHI